MRDRHPLRLCLSPPTSKGKWHLTAFLVPNHQRDSLKKVNITFVEFFVDFLSNLIISHEIESESEHQESGPEDGGE